MKHPLFSGSARSCLYPQQSPDRGFSVKHSPDRGFSVKHSPDRGFSVKHSPDRGFSVIELSVVIAIIAVLTGVAAIGFSQVTKNAQGAACSSNMQKIHTATMSYWTLFGTTADPAWTNGIQNNLDGSVINGTTSPYIRCPSGGTYTIATPPAAGEAPVKPTCSVYTGEGDANKSAQYTSGGLHYLK